MVIQCMKYVSFPWPPEEATLSIFNGGLFQLKNFLTRINKNREAKPSLPNHKLSKNVYNEKMRSVVQYIMWCCKQTVPS